jgi:hypothetical protein
MMDGSNPHQEPIEYTLGFAFKLLVAAFVDFLIVLFVIIFISFIIILTSIVRLSDESSIVVFKQTASLISLVIFTTLFIRSSLKIILEERQSN